MNDENNTKRLAEDDGSLAGEELLHAVRQDMQSLFGLVKALDQKVDARLHDTVPIWEAVVSRLDAIASEQANQGKRLDAIEAEQTNQGKRLDAIEAEQTNQGKRLDAIASEQANQSKSLDAIESEQRRQGARIDAIEGRLDAIEIKLERFDAIDAELRHLGRRMERTIGQLSKDVFEVRVAQHDLEDRLEKLEKTPA